MSTKTDIEWTDTTWNPVRGCSLVSAGCTNCYAMKQAHRFSGKGKPYEGLTEIGPQGPRWTGKLRLVPEALEEPLHWKQPRRIFVNSMSDLFHEDVPHSFIVSVFSHMEAAPQHTFQILTKRPARMLEQFRCGLSAKFPVLPNVHLGVSIEDQRTADERIPILLETPAAVRFISAEPLLGPLDLENLNVKGDLLDARTGELRGKESGCIADEGVSLDWVIVGGESGPGARPCDLAWIRSIKDQCQAAKVPVFFKQGGASNSCVHDRKGGCWDCMPLDLKIREYPHAT